MSQRLTRRMVMEGLELRDLLAVETACRGVLSSHRCPAWDTTEVTDLLAEVQSILRSRQPSGKYRP